MITNFKENSKEENKKRINKKLNKLNLLKRNFKRNHLKLLHLLKNNSAKKKSSQVKLVWIFERGVKPAFFILLDKYLTIYPYRYILSIRIFLWEKRL